MIISNDIKLVLMFAVLKEKLGGQILAKWAQFGLFFSSLNHYIILILHIMIVNDDIKLVLVVIGLKKSVRSKLNKMGSVKCTIYPV